MTFCGELFFFPSSRDQDRNHQYVGSTRDIGLVEVNFKLK
jgi:hypothetical protein